MTPVWPAWVLVALAEVGTTEIRGGENPRIMEYHRTVDPTGSYLDEDEDAWCSSFACWAAAQSGYQHSGSARAKSWLTVGETLTEPRRGCLAVLHRGAPGAATGHVGFVIAWSADKVWLLGGNQGDSVSVVAQDRRAVLGWRWLVPT